MKKNMVEYLHISSPFHKSNKIELNMVYLNYHSIHEFILFYSFLHLLILSYQKRTLLMQVFYLFIMHTLEVLPIFLLIFICFLFSFYYYDDYYYLIILSYSNLIHVNFNINLIFFILLLLILLIMLIYF